MVSLGTRAGRPAVLTTMVGLIDARSAGAATLAARGRPPLTPNTQNMRSHHRAVIPPRSVTIKMRGQAEVSIGGVDTLVRGWPPGQRLCCLCEQEAGRYGAHPAAARGFHTHRRRIKFINHVLKS